MNRHSKSRARLVSSTAPFVIAVLALTGCSESSASSKGSEPQTISFAFGAASNQDKAIYTGLARSYTETHKGTTIDPLNLPAESYASALVTRLQGGTAPDAFYINGGSGMSDSVVPLAKAGLLLRLTDPEVSSHIPSAQKDLWTYNGSVYGVPMTTGVDGVIYNQDLAKSIGVNIDASTSLDGVIKQCAIARAHGKTVYGLAGSTYQNNGFLAVGIATSTVYGSDKNWNEQRTQGKVTFAGTKGWVEALTYIKKMYDAGCFQDGAASAGFDALTNGATSGTILGFFAPSGSAKEIMDAAGGHVKLNILPIAGPADTRTYLSLSADLGISASAKTKSPKLTEDFLKYVVSDKGQKYLADASGTIPVSTSLSTSLLPQYSGVKGLISAGRVRGNGSDAWSNPKVYTDLGTGVQGMLTGQMTPQQVLKQMDADWG
ncbi:ABC transporter substrate-binding protein [Humibacter sp.]|uniref:ABC transporter substrate-binding protein n=1 Tax=Humibacter sp. TaxID=1940291 RepID=UPI003F807830